MVFEPIVTNQSILAHFPKRMYYLVTGWRSND
jgi:hypothetical protein